MPSDGPPPRTRNTFSPVAEAALARLTALTIDLAQKAALLPSNAERREALNDQAHLARDSYWPEPAVVVTEAYLDESAAHAELPEQHEVLAYLRELFVAHMVQHLPDPQPGYDEYYDEYDDDDEPPGEDVFDGEGWDHASQQPRTRLESLDEDPPEEEP